jgi:hypothetical protein
MRGKFCRVRQVLPGQTCRFVRMVDGKIAREIIFAAIRAIFPPIVDICLPKNAARRLLIEGLDREAVLSTL